MQESTTNAITSTSSVGAIAMVAGFCTLATGSLVTGVFIITTRHRYRELARMAQNLDRVLAGERDIKLHDMNEGELAILSSEIDKVIARLHLTVDELQAEKLALSDALADISHQLKTPLTSIAISTELIRDRLAERGNARDIVERLRLVQRLQGRVEDLVAALLKLARIDAGVIKLVSGPVDAAELVRKSFEPLAIAFDIAGVDFSSTIQEESGYEGDLSWSVEALGNILKNCMEHTPAGGRVTLCVTQDVLACRIRVEDTGPGIAEADLPHIFERFYRGERGRAEDEPSTEVNPAGVGIGLSLAKSLVTAQGGTLTAENVRDEAGAVTGAAFTIVFFKTVV
ncbi:MAG: sensor histidine kinase [Collinsella sp.]|uniref:sensor histidine kinase n=1 Tax=Collinsella sp. TaxID=1965294 RepID=UPI0039908CAB